LSFLSGDFVLTNSGRQQPKDVLKRLIGFAISGFDFGCGLGLWPWRRVEEAVGEGTANAFMKEHEQ
jgi:hypothetical protein